MKLSDPMNMKKMHEIDSEEQLRALSHPLRQRILEAMIPEERTTMQVARQLGEKPTRLYHHVAKLRDAGLIEQVRTRRVRGTVEKYHRAVAESFSATRKLMEMAPQGDDLLDPIQDAIVGLMDGTLADIRESIADGHFAGCSEEEAPVITRMHLFGTDEEQLLALRDKLVEWVHEAIETTESEGEAEYAATLAFFPIRRPTEEGRDE